MGLNNLNILNFYNSFDNNIAKEFYGEIFKHANKYDRVSAFFDAKIFKEYSEELYEFFKKGGKIRYILSIKLSEEDFNNILKGYKCRNKDNVYQFSNLNYSSLDDKERQNFTDISFLVKNNFIDIKIAVTKLGIFHDKYGIFTLNKEKIFFRGSNNETKNSIMYNYESFETICSWNSSKSDNKRIKLEENRFEKLWNNEINNVFVLDVIEIARSKLMEYNIVKTTDEKYDNINKVILDLGLNNRVICFNNLFPNKIDVRDLTFKAFLKRYTKSATNEEIIFKENLNYAEIKKIRDGFIEYSTELNFDIIITNKLNSYIELMDLDLKHREKLGIDIKNHEQYLNIKFNEFKEILDVEMERKLKEKQLWDAFHIVSMYRSANFSVPGSGKTSIVYGAFAYLNRNNEKKVDKIVMIGPKNSFLSWKEEFKLNFGNKKKLMLIDCQENKYKNKKNLKEDLLYNSGNVNLILINYEKVDGLKEILSSIINEKTLLVFDEAHKIKAIDGVWSNAALQICEKAKYKVVLTGTPIPNSYADIYNMLKILYPEEYNVYFKFTPTELQYASEFKAEEINKAINPFFCRTTKKDLKIPVPNDDIEIKSSMNELEEKLFEIIRKKYRKNILTLYIRLLQASTNPKLLLKNIDISQINDISYTEDEEIINGYTIDDVDNSIKLDEPTKNLIKSIDMTTKYKDGINLLESLCKDGKKVVVWGIFIDTLFSISRNLDKLNIANKVICGSTPQSERETIIDRFKNGDVQVLITNPHTLAESVSLHTVCHDAIYFEYSFNLIHMLQSKDRINRLGLEETDYTQYYYLELCNNSNIIYDSVDRKTLKRLKEKEKIMIKSIEGTKLVRTDFNDIDDIKIILDKI